MPESYNGNEGNQAQGAGFDVMDGAEKWAGTNGGWRGINKTRDMIVTALNQAKAYADSLVESISLSWANITGKPSTFPPSAHTHSSLSTGPVSFGWNGGLNRWNTPESISASAAVFGNDVNVGGHIYVPNSTQAVTGYTNAFIDVAGRLCRGASSIRYKDLLDDPDVSMIGNIWPTLRAFTMKGGDGKPLFGYIAEELAAEPAQEPFVIYGTAPDGQGGIATTDVPESIDFIQLLLTQVAVLHARDQQRELELEQLHNKVAELEARP